MLPLTCSCVVVFASVDLGIFYVLMSFSVSNFISQMNAELSMRKQNPGGVILQILSSLLCVYFLETICFHVLYDKLYNSEADPDISIREELVGFFLEKNLISKQFGFRKIKRNRCIIQSKHYKTW